MAETITGGGPPKVLICDSNNEMAEKLGRELSNNSLVDSIEVANSIEQAWITLASSTLDIVLLGLLSFDLHESSDFLFTVRRDRPGVVFALYVDRQAYEHEAEFFDGELSRLSHYYLLDRTLDGLDFAQELQHVLVLCLMDLGTITRE